jgi:beta-glucosidase
MAPEGFAEVREVLIDLTERGKISRERIDASVLRILELKFSLGLFEQPFADRSLLSSVGSDAHRALAREAVRKSLVLLKNEGQTLPSILM